MADFWTRWIGRGPQTTLFWSILKENVQSRSTCHQPTSAGLAAFAPAAGDRCGENSADIETFQSTFDRPAPTVHTMRTIIRRIFVE
jgi:hypothetical protein